MVTTAEYLHMITWTVRLMEIGTHCCCIALVAPGTVVKRRGTHNTSFPVKLSIA